jgi:hypothetical protein
MGALTTFFNLFKPAKTDGVSVADVNPNWDTIDTELHRPPLTVNGVAPDATTRNLYLEEVPLADNLASDIAQINNGTYIIRTSGGGSSIESGDASLVTIKGNLTRAGYVAESLDMTVTPAQREEGVDPITATIDRDTFVEYVTESGTTTLAYTDAWSADPTDYGITVTGTPVSGDIITVVYVKENRGTITVADPTGFNSTGWNLYDNATGTARVVAYSQEYGFKIGGNYSLVDFSPTLSGTRTSVVVTGGYFNVDEDGYLFITGGDATTYIYPTWSDWVTDYNGDFQTYTVDTISLTEAMLNFPYGLCAIGEVRDEININVQRTIQRITRVAYSAENLATVIESGAQYIYDTNYIYSVLAEPVSTAIVIDGTYTVSDHGTEFFSGTTIPVYTEILYGENLKDKLRTDVLTISQQTLTSTQKTQARTNIGAASAEDLATLNSNLSAFSGVGIANNLTTSTAGYVLDARQGKVLSDAINGIPSATGSNDYSSIAYYYKKIGRIVVLSVRMTPKADISSTTGYIGLPGSIAPMDVYYAPVSRNDDTQNELTARLMQVSASGVRFNGSYTHNVVYSATIAYMSKT